MNKKVKKIEKKYKIVLDNYILVERKKGHLKYYYLLMPLFILSVILNQLNVEFFNLLTVAIFALVFLALPISMIYEVMSNKIIITSKGMFLLDKTDRIINFKYSSIKSVLKINGTLQITDSHNKVKIIKSKFNYDFTILETIFEAKGYLTHDDEYLIRPIEILVTDNKLVIVELEDIETDIQKIVGELYNNYDIVTPGYINYFVFRNSVFDKPTLKGNDLYIKMNKVDVKVDHPENISHEAIEVNDVVVLFKNITEARLYVKDPNVRGSKNDLVTNKLEEIIDSLENCVVSDSFVIGDNKFQYLLSNKIMMNTFNFTYEEVIVGWNETKGQSWFQKDEVKLY
ncbi:hypothetical protein [Candidatus Izimaplasma sp. ZiA1]|uniref:hypothetical protein n=1 Tax=Candidatus Izimoplasma sp. ZiA1 TaxID=2024899 RepID=UPI001177A3AC